MSESELKRAFDNAQVALMVCLNGIGGPIATDAEVVELRRAVLRARAACEAAGIHVETFMESEKRQHVENVAYLREYAADLEASGKLPLICREWRLRLARIAGLVIAVASFAHLAGPQGLVVGAVAGLFGYAAADWVLRSLSPTIGLKAGRCAAQLHIGIVDIWPAGSPEQKDFEMGFRFEYMQMQRRGECGTIRVQ